MVSLSSESRDLRLFSFRIPAYHRICNDAYLRNLFHNSRENVITAVNRIKGEILNNKLFKQLNGSYPMLIS